MNHTIIRRYLLNIVFFLTGLGLLAWGAALYQPYLAGLRRIGVIMLPMTLVIGFFWLLGYRRYLLAALWAAGLVVTLAAQADYQRIRQSVLADSAPSMAMLGRHFVIGYRQVDQIKPLAAKGLIGGIFITRRNLGPRLAAEIAELQELRRAHGLPPLMVAADQEGGIVSNLSPLLPAMAPLSDLAAMPASDYSDAARRYGYLQGRGMASLGITANFSPVLDLKRDRLRWDRNSLISRRAIDDDPRVVADIARAYGQGLISAGITPTAKHFPGLGRVRGDTHHVRTRITATAAELEASDWLPFREMLTDGKTQLMVGHTIIDAIDPASPASGSALVINGLIRQKWGFDGLVLTDDLTMPSIHRHGFCKAVVAGLNAGADLLLITYDGDQLYRALDCARSAWRNGRLNRDMVKASERRLAW